MSWSKTVPAGPGWYWWRAEIECRQQNFYIDRAQYIRFAPALHILAGDIGGEWYSEPIKEPE